MCNTTSNLGTWKAYLPNNKLAKCLPRIRHFILLLPQPQLRFFYALALDLFASIEECGWRHIIKCQCS